MPESDAATAALRRVPTQSRSRDKVARAIAAAEELVRREGVEAISLPRVASEAGVSVGALYQYLPDRAAITAAIVARYHARLEALLDAVIDDMAGTDLGPDPVGRVLRAVAGVYREEQPARSLGTVSTGAEADAARAAHRHRMAAKVEVLIGRLALLEGAPPERVATVARVAFTATDAVLRDAFAASEPEREALLAEIERVLRAALGA
jgi:AcrR family transcriptional regulator